MQIHSRKAERPQDVAMDIFVRHIPNEATNKELKRYFRKPLEECGIHHFHAEKMGGKDLAVLTVLSKEDCQRFLTLYGVPAFSHASVQATRRLVWKNKTIKCTPSNREPDSFSVQAIAYELSQRAAQASAVTAPHANGAQNAKITRFAIHGLRCGTWDYSGTQLVFTQHFSDGRQGSVSLGFNGAVILLGGSDTTQCRIDLSYHDCGNIVSGTYDNPTITFTLKIPPKFYEISGEDALAAAILNMTLGSRPRNSTETKKTRVTSINDKHAKIAGVCFVYRITLSDYNQLGAVRTLLNRNPKMPPTISTGTPTVLPPESLDQSSVRLSHELTDSSRYGKLPFNMLYQLDRLARNGVLSPRKVQELLPKISKILEQHGQDAALSAIRRFYRKVPFAGPETESSELSKYALEQMLDEFADEYDQYQYNPENPYQIVKRHTHINLIHKIVVTPAGMFLEGPEPEPTNRVLRKYEDRIDHFMRVVFQDEDGGAVRYDPRASQDVIFHERFKEILDTHILIAGRAFSFLGFSHSSLRAQSCWFMAPIFRDGSLRLPEHILRELGDFSTIRIPAKCAARIGQNFTDT